MNKHRYEAPNLGLPDTVSHVYFLNFNTGLSDIFDFLSRLPACTLTFFDFRAKQHLSFSYFLDNIIKPSVAEILRMYVSLSFVISSVDHYKFVFIKVEISTRIPHDQLDISSRLCFRFIDRLCIVGANEFITHKAIKPRSIFITIVVCRNLVPPSVQPSTFIVLFSKVYP